MKFYNYSSVQIIIFIFSQLLLCCIAKGQQPAGNKAAADLVQLYSKEMGASRHLYNGSEYAVQGHNIKGFPYFESQEILTGSVFYDGNLYSSIPMYYDLVNDELVIKDFTNNYPILLVKNKVKYFDIAGHRFINVAPVDSSVFSITPGFYDELYKSGISLLAKREKKILQSANPELDDTRYQQYNHYYILKDDKLIEVNGERSLLNALKDKKDAVKKFIRQYQLNFKKDFETAAIKTIQYYDSLAK